MTADNTPELIEQWIQDLHQNGKSRYTQVAYQRAINHFVAWSEKQYGDAFEVIAVIARDVRDWRVHQQTVEKAAPATINQRLVAVSRFFKWATATGIIRSDPTLAVHSLQVPEREPQALANPDLRRFMRAVYQNGNKRDIAIVEVLVGTGLRVGELLQLNIGDLEMSERQGKLTVRHGKHGRFREVPLSKEVRYALRAYLDEHPQRLDPHALLWLGATGPVKHRSSILRLLEKYALYAGIEAISPHILRHTFATRYLAANPDDLRGLARLLGHSSLDTVMIYTEPLWDDLARRIERTGEMS